MRKFEQMSFRKNSKHKLMLRNFYQVVFRRNRKHDNGEKNPLVFNRICVKILKVKKF